ncbi:MAG TPA: AmmeMemoRadiSam system protein B [Gemmatimonadota bacterium]|jgi:AmmeMemoRadiSam system protein B|nr:AmmeMemoRadiSam system protein B [Gemmatimonadota bacterium]
MKETGVRPAAVAGYFYPANARKLDEMVDAFLAEVEPEGRAVRGLIAPHAGLVYSGGCAAQVFGRVTIPATVVILAPNHTGRCEAPGGASIWSSGAFDTPLGRVAIAEDFARELEARSPLVDHDPQAHREEHAVEVELPFLRKLAPQSAIVPIVVAWDDWGRSQQLAAVLAALAEEWPEDVLLVASSDMTHFDTAGRAAEKDRLALAAIERLDGEELLNVCRREQITMCGRAPAAVVVEAARRLGATRAEVVDYRHSGWVTGDESSVVAYAGVTIA